MFALFFFLFCQYVHLYHFSRFNTCTMLYDIYFSLSDLASPCMTVSRSIHVSENGKISFLFLKSPSNIPLYICIVCVRAQLCSILCDPMDCSWPGSSVHGIFQARILPQVAISFTRASSWPRDRSWVSCVSCIGRQMLFYCATWEGCMYVLHLLYPFLCLWTSRLLLCLGCCIQRCSEHWGACSFLSYGFLWV